MKILQTMTFVIVIILLSLFAMGIITTIYEASKEIPVSCSEYGDVKYRWIGGLFGGIKQIVDGEFYDGYMEVCIKGKTAWGGEWKRK